MPDQILPRGKPFYQIIGLVECGCFLKVGFITIIIIFESILPKEDTVK